MPGPIFIDQYVREAFHGLLLDELDPFDYFATDADRDNDQAAAVELMAKDLASRYGRGLTMSELVKLTIQVASQWQQERQNEEERVGMAAIARSHGEGNSTSERAALREAGRLR